jgi:hypothetical protein
MANEIFTEIMLTPQTDESNAQLTKLVQLFKDGGSANDYDFMFAVDHIKDLSDRQSQDDYRIDDFEKLDDSFLLTIRTKREYPARFVERLAKGLNDGAAQVQLSVDYRDEFFNLAGSVVYTDGELSGQIEEDIDTLKQRFEKQTQHEDFEIWLAEEQVQWREKMISEDLNRN